MTAQVLGKVMRRLAKKVVVSGIIIGICMMVMQVNQAIGVILMMLYSSLMVLNSSRREMPLGKFTALLPGGVSIVTFSIMLALLQLSDPVMPVIGIGLGITAGFFMARGHKVYRKNGMIYSKRTFLYILIWVLSTLFTQGATLAGMREITDFGFLLSGFSTAMMVVLSCVLLFRLVKIKKHAAVAVRLALFSVIVIISLMSPALKHARATDFQANNGVGVSSTGVDLLDESLFSQFKYRMIDYSVNRSGSRSGYYRATLDGSPYGGRAPGTETARRNILIPDIFDFELIDTRIYTSEHSWEPSLSSFVNKFNHLKISTCKNNKYFRRQSMPTQSGEGYMCYQYRDLAEQRIHLLWRNDRWILFHKSSFDWSDSEQIRRQQRAISLAAADSIIAKLESITTGSSPISPSPHRPAPSSGPVTSSSDTAAAGAASALAMLLAALGLNAANIAAQEAANAFMAAAQDVGPDIDPEHTDTGNVILDGPAAEQWMRENGYFNQDGTPTQNYYDFMNSSYSEDAATGLQGFAGHTDDNGTPDGNFSIIVSGGEPPVQEARDSQYSNIVQDDEEEAGEPSLTAEDVQNGDDEQEYPESITETVDDPPPVEQSRVSSNHHSPDSGNDHTGTPGRGDTATETQHQSGQDKNSEQPGTAVADARDDEPGYFDTIYNRVRDGVKDLGTELYNAGRDVYNDTGHWDDKDAPSIVRMTYENIKDEVSRTADDAYESVGSALDEVKNAFSDVVRDPSILSDTLSGSRETVVNGVDDAGRFVGDSAEDLRRAAEDVYEDPEIIKDTLSGMADTVGDGADHVIRVVSDPDKVVDGIKDLTGIQNFENSVDENRTLAERLGNVALGTFNMAGAVSGAEAAGQAIREGAATIMGEVGRAAGGFVDDAGRMAASSIDDVGRVGAAGIENVADDAARGATALADEVDDAVRMSAEGTSTSDDVARNAAQLGDQVSESSGLGTGTAAGDAERGSAALAESVPENEFVQVAENGRREKNPYSTIRPGTTADFVPADVPPDTSGYTAASERHIKMVADQHGVKIHTRPANSYARELLDSDRALPKPPLIKNRTINDLDTLLGASKEDLGKVGHFEPHLPEQGSMSTTDYGKLTNRFNDRLQEFKDQNSYLASHSDEVVVRNGVVFDRQTNKPFTSDVDGFAIRGMNNEPLPAAVVERVERDLQYGIGRNTDSPHSPGNVMHGVHVEWDYSDLPRTPREGGGQSAFDIARERDVSIRAGHEPGGEALVTYSAEPGMEPPDPDANYWTGGRENPLVDKARKKS